MNNPKVCIATILILSLTAPSHAVWTLVRLHPSGSNIRGSVAFGTSAANQVGVTTVADVRPHASLWSGTSGSWVDLHPFGGSIGGSEAYGVSGTSQVGSVGVPEQGTHAALWAGTAASWVDLTPGAHGVAYAVSGAHQVGMAETGSGTHASLWTGTAASLVDLNPGGATESVAFGVSGTSQVGYAATVDWAHASLWSGTSASWVDLHPAGYEWSMALAVSGPYQVGKIRVGGVFHASLWSGTAASCVDLNPAGSTESLAYGVFGTNQVGESWVGNNSKHASLWSGTAASWVDLHPPGFNTSYATSMWADSLNEYISGAGTNTMTGIEEALLWTQPLPRTVSGHVNFAGGRVLNAIEVQFREAGTLTNVGGQMIVPVDANGSYEVFAPVRRLLDLTLMPKGCLRRTIYVNTSTGDFPNADINLVPGNILPDYVIDLSDYTQVITHFNKNSSNPNWNSQDFYGIRPSDSDLNGDGVVDLTDYILVVTNFNAVGDN
ncbi:MAG: hypothetical protein K8R88_00895 [Armatimonadetes bacterium]|nr:hypothetical protein [Armatimonadota bacterium]